MARTDPPGPSRRYRRVGRCQACGTTRQLDACSWDQYLISPGHGAIAP
jgi:hypothetical protein